MTSQEEFQPYLFMFALRCASCERAWPNLKHSCIHISNFMFFHFKYIQLCQLCLNKVGGIKARKYAIFTEKKKSSFGPSEPTYYTLASELPACCTNPFKQRGDHLWNPRLPFPHWSVTTAALVHGSTLVPRSDNWPMDDEPRETECCGYFLSLESIWMLHFKQTHECISGSMHKIKICFSKGFFTSE